MADKIFINGVVRSMVPGREPAQALAVTGSQIDAIGSAAEVMALRGPGTEVIDLEGRCLLPGFHDSHVHLTQHGFELSQLRLDEVGTLEEAVDLVAERVDSMAPGRWLLGAGFSLQRWGVDSLHRRDLDRVSSHHPVLLRSQDHHGAWANTAALKAAAVGSHTPDPPHGTIVRDADGTPTGMLLERAFEPLRNAAPKPDRSAIRAALVRAATHLGSLGVTTVHHMAFEPVDQWRELALAASDSDYPLRVWACVPHEDIEHAAAVGLATGQGGANFAVGGAKFFADGALGSRTAWMLDPYLDRGGLGVAVDGPDTLSERVPKAIAAGLVPVVHAIGDAAVRAVVDALEAQQSVWRSLGMRPRIEHAQHVHPDDVGRLGSMGLIASMQPIHLTFDATSIRAGLSDRLERAYPMRSLKAAGATLVFGSDTPVADPDVFVGLRAACRRLGRDGPPLTSDESLGPDEALAAYTRDAAYAIGRERRSGQLRPGYDADLVLLSHDPVDGLDDLEVAWTVKAGRFSHGGPS